ncbi:MAG TPA: hypothetical protein VJR91_19920 [Burkholderia sp.]|nr:hypothetical protein [Burkholderia sp.]
MKQKHPTLAAAAAALTASGAHAQSSVQRYTVPATHGHNNPLEVATGIRTRF